MKLFIIALYKKNVHSECIQYNQREICKFNSRFCFNQQKRLFIVFLVQIKWPFEEMFIETSNEISSMKNMVLHRSITCKIHAERANSNGRLRFETSVSRRLIFYTYLNFMLWLHEAN